MSGKTKSVYAFTIRSDGCPAEMKANIFVSKVPERFLNCGF